MRPTCSLSARPSPDTASLTSLGVASRTGTPARRGCDQHDPARLANRESRLDVAREEQSLDGHQARPMEVNELGEAVLDCQQTVG